jgi:peptide deformylase
MRSEGDFRLKTGIIGFGSPILAQKCEKVLDFDQNLHNLLKLMKDAMEMAKGVGLAANQLGVNLSAFVFDFEGNSGEILNPMVRRRSASKALGVEGCLSAPGIDLEVNRATSIRVSGHDRDGKDVEITASGYLARILQHEIDHLEGVCIADRLKRSERRALTRHLRSA